MFTRIWHAFANKATLYQDLKAGIPGWESWVVILIAFAVEAIITAITSTVPDGMLQFFIQLIGYLVMAFWAWLIGAVIGKGKGSFADVQKAIAYPYFVPTILGAIPMNWVGDEKTGLWVDGIVKIVVALWFLVTLSTAIRETLGIGKRLTYFIVISGGVMVMVFLFPLLIGLASLAIAGALSG